jgi:MFS family permease
MAHALCQNFGGLMATRFLLGVGESAVSPGFTLIVASFYKRQEQPLRYTHTLASMNLSALTKTDVLNTVKAPGIWAAVSET